MGRLCSWQVFLPAFECFSRCLLSPGSVRFLGGASAGWAALACWPGRNQPGHGWSHPCAAPVWSGRSSAVSGDSAASVPRAAGGLQKSGRDVALLGVTPSCGSAVCFGLGIASAAALSGVGLWQRRERQGRSPSALLPKNARMKRAARILSPGRVCSAHTDLVPCGPVPVGAASSGNFMEGEREKRSGFPAPSENMPSHPGRGTALLLQAWAGSSGEGAQAADTGSVTSRGEGTLCPLLRTKPAGAFLGTSTSLKAKDGLRGSRPRLLVVLGTVRSVFSLWFYIPGEILAPE